MSTKIYNAYKFNGDLEKLNPFLKKIRSLHIERCVKKLIDKKAFLPKKPFKVLDLIKKHSDSQLRHPFNFDASIVVYFHNNSTYIQFFGCDKVIKDLPDSINALLQDFHYQNQVDMSNYDWDKEPWEEMSEERQQELEDDWDHRERVWNEILIGSGVPSEHGLIYELYNTSILSDIIDNFITKNKE